MLFLIMYPVVPPVIDNSTSTLDVPISIEGNLFPLILDCPIKISLPAPNIVWLHNGIPINVGDSNAILSFNAMQKQQSANILEYDLSITSTNRTYQFVKDNIIGMYQCLASNKGGQAIISRRVLFKCKLNSFCMCTSYVYVIQIYVIQVDILLSKNYYHYFVMLI